MSKSQSQALRLQCKNLLGFFSGKEIRLLFTMSIVHDNHNLSLCESFMKKFSTSFAEEKFFVNIFSLTRSHKVMQASSRLVPAIL